MLHFHVRLSFPPLVALLNGPNFIRFEKGIVQSLTVNVFVSYFHIYDKLLYFKMMVTQRLWVEKDAKVFDFRTHKT